jgi:hypothetical protein
MQAKDCVCNAAEPWPYCESLSYLDMFGKLDSSFQQFPDVGTPAFKKLMAEAAKESPVTPQSDGGCYDIVTSVFLGRGNLKETFKVYKDLIKDGCIGISCSVRGCSCNKPYESCDARMPVTSANKKNSSCKIINSLLTSHVMLC